MNQPLTATEIKEGLERTHDTDCNCELCYVRAYIETMQKAFLEPLIERTKEILRKRGIKIPKDLR